MKTIFEQIPVGPMDNFSYLIGSEQAHIAAIVDPAGEVHRIVGLAKDHSVDIKYIVNTHSHGDHTRGNKELAKMTGAKIMQHERSSDYRDVALKDGYDIQLGEVVITVIHTPGHTPDSICLLVDGKLLTGDTLFVGECGRTDLPGGDPRQMYESLLGKIVKLPDKLEVYPGHDYGDRPHSTLGYEKKNNYTLESRTLEEFIEFMRTP